MSVLASGFWPWFWTLLSLGAVATAAMCLLIAFVGRPRTGRCHEPPAPQAPRPAACEPAAGSADGEDLPAGRHPALA